MESPLGDPPSTQVGSAPLPPDATADELVGVVRRAVGRIVVVLGPRSSGKTQFLRKRAIPRLEALGRVRCFDCATAVDPAAIDAVSEAGTLVVLDSFDRLLKLPEVNREPALRALFTDRRRATVILVASNSCLAELFDLRRLVPDILEHRFEMSGLRLRDELPRYSPSPGVSTWSWTPQVLEALESDLARLPDGTMTWPLLALIDEGFRAGAYDPKHGLIGLLETHLERTLARAGDVPDLDERSSDVARAVLKEIAAGGGREPGWLDDVAERLDVPPRTAELCSRWLLDNSGLLKTSASEELELQPAQLGIVLDRWLAEDRSACARAARYLADGIEGRTKVGTLLPRERFNDVHAQRSLLKTTPEEAAFLTRCALRSYPEGNTAAVDHWLNRIGDPTLKVSTLCEALVDPLPRARRLAAALLADMDEPRVHGHLCHAALEDVAAEVRQQAIDSLAGFVHKEPIRDVLTRAATTGPEARRIRAIEALRIFQDEECARFLESVVASPNDAEVRAAAVRALALTRSETGTAALVRVALHDADADDRARACNTLSLLASPILVELGWQTAIADWESNRPAKQGQWWKKFGHWPAVLLILWMSLYLHGLPLLFFRRWRAALTFVAVEALCVVGIWNEGGEWWFAVWLLNWLVSIVVSARVAHREAAAPGTLQRVMSNALLATTMLTSGLVLHGLGHWVTGRRRQALRVFGAEAIAIIAIWPTFVFESAFNQGTGSYFDTLTQSMLYLYRFGGLALSWLWAVSWLYLNEHWGQRGPWRSKSHAAVLRALLTAPESALALRDSLADPARAGVARMLLAHFGDAVPGLALLSVLEHDTLTDQPCPAPLVQGLSRHKDQKGYETVVVEAGRLFDRLQPAQRGQLVEVLLRNPTESSVLCLSDRRHQLRTWDRLRLLVAAIRRPFLGWHWAVRLVTVATALLGLLLAADGFRTTLNSGWPQIKELRRLSRMSDLDRSAEVATIADFLAKRYARESATELVTVYHEVVARVSPTAPDSSVWEGYAAGLASSLGVVATTSAEPMEGNECIALSGPRAVAVDALVSTVLNQRGNARTRDHAIQALQAAADRGGSIELVCGLATLFANSRESGNRTILAEGVSQLQGRIASMLASVATPGENVPTTAARSEAAKDAIARQADTLSSLLQAAVDADTKRALLRALAISGRDESVAAIKRFIVDDSAPLLRRQPDTNNTNDQRRALEDAELGKTRLELRAAAADGLVAIKSAAAETAVMDLLATAKLPSEVVKKAAAALDAQAQQLQQDGKLDEALQRSMAAVAADKGNASAHGTLASLLYGQGKFDESFSELKAATDLEPAYSWAYYMQALILKEQKQYPRAEAALRQAIDTDPHFAWSYVLLREIYVDQNRDADAIAALEKYRTRTPDVGEIYSQLAFVYHERIALRDPSAYQRACEVNWQLLALSGNRDPEQALSAEMNLVECRLTTGQYAELIARVTELQPRIAANPDYLMTAELLTLAAQALTQDRQGALKTLADLRGTYEGKFRGTQQRNNWAYYGTLAYLNRQPQTPQIASVVTLLKVVNTISQEPLKADQHPSEIPVQVFEHVRMALQPPT